MRDIQILQQTLENQCPDIHKKRLRSLILATKTVLDGSDLTLTKIGRALDTDTTVSMRLNASTDCSVIATYTVKKTPFISGMRPLLPVPTLFLWCSLIGQMFASSYVI